MSVNLGKKWATFTHDRELKLWGKCEPILSHVREWTEKKITHVHICPALTLSSNNQYLLSSFSVLESSVSFSAMVFPWFRMANWVQFINWKLFPAEVFTMNLEVEQWFHIMIGKKIIIDNN